MKIETKIFYSYQVVNLNNETICLGDGTLCIDTTWKKLDLLECKIYIKEEIQKTSKKRIDWSLNVLHLLAFNKFPE